MTDESAHSPSPSYQLTETAEAELAQILDAIATTNGVQRALHIWSKFEEAFRLLAFEPGAGIKRSKLTGEHVRWWFVFKWIVIYDPEIKPTPIMRIIYGPQELEDLLSPEAFGGPQP